MAVTAGAISALAASSAVASEPALTLERAGIPVCPPGSVSVRPGASKRVAIGCDGLEDARVRVVKPPRHGRLGPVDRGDDRVRYRPDPGYSGRDRILIARRVDGRVWRSAVNVAVGGAKERRARPRCAEAHVIARYRGETRVRFACRGPGLGRLRIVAGPRSGELDEVERPRAVSRRPGSENRRVLTATYDPEPRFAGQETILVGARGATGSAFGATVVSVLPWRMRALGDSVTAGFGFFGDPAHNGFAMPAEDLLDCRPPTAVNNRCSSNSDARPGYTGTPEWSGDFGLANNVSWAAQFANGIQGGGAVTAPDMFQNLAVTGSAPADWLPQGALNDELEAIAAEDPDLIALTLGANPLLSDFLLSVDGEECAESDDVAELEACIQPYIDRNQVPQRLQEIYETLLGAPSATVVVFQYHLAIPAANLFEVWQLEVMGDKLNEQIEIAVANTRATLPADADRLRMIPAQTTPGTPPTGMLPRFNIGLPPDGQGWTPVYDCGGGDLVDGPSHQSLPSQDEFEAEHPFEYCQGDEWIIGADTGIHPNRDGYAQFAAVLADVVSVPRLP